MCKDVVHNELQGAAKSIPLKIFGIFSAVA